MASGTWDPNANPDKSKLQFGIDAQVEVANLFYDLQYFKVAPYYQTDFRSQAEVYGTEFSWEPYRADVRLGGGVPFSPYFDFFWTSKLLVDYRHVGDAGGSGLDANSNYVWMGGSVGLDTLLFPQALDHKLSLNTRYDWFRNVLSAETAALFDASIGWKLSGAASVSLDYRRGRDKDTLTDTNKVELSLSFKR